MNWKAFGLDVLGGLLTFSLYLLAAWLIEQVTGFTFDRCLLLLIVIWMAEENWRKTK